MEAPTTHDDPIETLLRVEALNLRKDELKAETDRIVRQVEVDPTLAPSLLPRMEAINAEMDLIVQSARDMRREQIEGALRERDKAAALKREPWWRRLISWL
jgi:Ribonuclease G/E